MPFSLTEDQYVRVLNRLTALESSFNDLCVAVDKFITVQQLSELLVVIQTQLDTTEDTVDSLESRVVAIEEEPLT